MEVLQLIAEGKANKKTADKLGIGIKTVEKHREYPFRSGNGQQKNWNTVFVPNRKIRVAKNALIGVS